MWGKEKKNDWELSVIVRAWIFLSEVARLNILCRRDEQQEGRERWEDEGIKAGLKELKVKEEWEKKEEK